LDGHIDASLSAGHVLGESSSSSAKFKCTADMTVCHLIVWIQRLLRNNLGCSILLY